ncbi:kin of IRRE-like protein 1 [Anneissia japonica]|uniref:kin of IRRE-like protein 1 n=1 Tax=Anneissia japonica TaxID=1529436 RepID=UPI001425A585|nr:kin of IRRE-like protein 1 [Anneissia japonica]
MQSMHTNGLLSKNHYSLMKTLTMSIFLLLIFSTFVLRASAVQQFSLEPQSTQAVIGLEKVILKCVVTNKIGELFWLKDSHILGSDKDPQLSGVPRYSIVGDANNGEYNLQIQDVVLEDDGQYECQVLAGTEGETLRSAPLAKLTVIRPPISVSIENSPTLSAVEGIPIELVCRGLKGNPAAEIKWYRDGAVVEGAVYSTEPSQNDPTGKLHDAKSVLSITPTLTDDAAVYTCQVTNAALNEPYKAIIDLDVQYKPVVVIESSHQTVKENNEVIFNCVADANPDTMTYAWYRSDVIIEGASEAQLQKRITKNDNGVTFKCVATNAVGSGEDSIQLNVHFAPFFTTYPEDISVDFGEQAIIECAADGNPKPAIKWTRLGSRVTISTMNRLQFDTVKDSDVGMYVCTATVTGFEAEVHYARLDINSIPVIESKEEQCTELGSTAQINCFTDTKPDPMMIEWNWDDGDMRLETGTSIDRFSAKKEGIKGGVRSILFIEDTAEEDMKPYNCTIWNEKGVSWLMITLKPCEMDMIIFIIIGVVSGSILILTLTVIGIMCCKFRYNRRKKLTLNEEEEEKQSVEIIRRLSDYDLSKEEKESKYNKEYEESKGSPESTRSSHDRYAVPSKIMHKRRDSWDSYDRPPSRGMRYYNGPYSRRHFNDYVEPEYLPYRGRSCHDYAERPRDFPRHRENEKARDDYYKDSLYRNNRYNRRKDEYREREWKKKKEDIIETREAVETISNHSNDSEHNLATDV